MKNDVDFFMTTFLRTLAAREPPIPLQIDGEPCLLVHGDLSAILLIFENGEHLAQFHEAITQARSDQAGSSRIDHGVIHGPSGVIAMPPGARIDEHWQTLKAGIYDGQHGAVRR